jgi:hypothetical protein
VVVAEEGQMQVGELLALSTAKAQGAAVCFKMLLVKVLLFKM